MCIRWKLPSSAQARPAGLLQLVYTVHNGSVCLHLHCLSGGFTQDVQWVTWFTHTACQVGWLVYTTGQETLHRSLPSLQFPQHKCCGLRNGAFFKCLAVIRTFKNYYIVNLPTFQPFTLVLNASTFPWSHVNLGWLAGGGHCCHTLPNSLQDPYVINISKTHQTATYGVLI